MASRKSNKSGIGASVARGGQQPRGAMPAPWVRALKKDRAARKVVHAWRQLTGGGTGRDAARRTLVACSGGADSSALALVLSQLQQRGSGAVVLGHIVHDMRPEREALADLARVQELGVLACVPVLVGRAHAVARSRRTGDNVEHAARKERYGALAQLACEHRCAFIATAHQGDDLMETLLMRLVRGTGVQGLVGIHESIDISSDRALRIIRPMLCLSRAESEALCTLAGWRWCEDATNADASRLRARIRKDVMPVLRSVQPSLHKRALATSRVMLQAREAIASLAHAQQSTGVETAREAQAASKSRGGAAPSRGDAAPMQATLRAHAWPRDYLRDLPRGVVEQVLRDAALSLGAHADKLSQRVLGSAWRAVADIETRPRAIALGGVQLRVTIGFVSVETPAASAHASISTMIPTTINPNTRTNARRGSPRKKPLKDLR